MITIKKRLVSVINGDEKIYAQVKFNPELRTKENVNIELKIIGEPYSYTILPNGETTENESVNYEAAENGIYIFKIYDADGNCIEKSVKIENIDRTPPVGTCTIEFQDGFILYNVNASDESGIKNYSYYSNNEYTDFINADTFKSKSNDEVASVIVQDMAGNTSKISCTNLTLE